MKVFFSYIGVRFAWIFIWNQWIKIDRSIWKQKFDVQKSINHKSFRFEKWARIITVFPWSFSISTLHSISLYNVFDAHVMRSIIHSYYPYNKRKTIHEKNCSECILYVILSSHAQSFSFGPGHEVNEIRRELAVLKLCGDFARDTFTRTRQMLTCSRVAYVKILF